MNDRILQIIVFIALITAPFWLGAAFHPDRTDDTEAHYSDR